MSKRERRQRGAGRGTRDDGGRRDTAGLTTDGWTDAAETPSDTRRSTRVDRDGARGVSEAPATTARQRRENNGRGDDTAQGDTDTATGPRGHRQDVIQYGGNE